MVLMSLFSWQGQNLCGLSLTFILDWRVVTVSDIFDLSIWVLVKRTSGCCLPVLPWAQARGPCLPLCSWQTSVAPAVTWSLRSAWTGLPSPPWRHSPSETPHSPTSCSARPRPGCRPPQKRPWSGLQCLLVGILCMVTTIYGSYDQPFCFSKCVAMELLPTPTASTLT